MVCIGNLPRTLSRTSVLTASLLAPLVVAMVTIGLGDRGVVNLSIGNFHGHFHPIAAMVLYVTTALLMHQMMSAAAKRRRETIHRGLIIDECNHHIRNALQSMSGTAYLNGYEEINAAVTRIESTLKNVLPRVQVSGDAGLIGGKLMQEAQSRETLETPEMQLDLLYDHVPAGMVKLSDDGHILMANPAMCTMLGYTPEEFNQKTCEDISEATDYAKESTLIRELFGRKLSGYACKKRYIHKNGSPVRVEIFSTLVYTGSRTCRILVVDKPDETLRAS